MTELGAWSGVKVEVKVPSSSPGIREKTLSARQIEEVLFWSPQMMEHALFLHIGLSPSPFIVETQLLEGTEPSQRTQVPSALQTNTSENAKLVAKLKMRAKQVMLAWKAFLGLITQEQRIDVPILNNLINHTRYLKSRIIDLQKLKVWVGWLFPEFVEHLRDELDYFVQRFNDTISPDAERMFWTEINAEHLALTARLLDFDYPAGTAASNQFARLADEGLALIDQVPMDHGSAHMDLLQMIQLSRQFDHLAFATKADLLHAAAWNNGAPANGFQPLILAHTLREGQRSLTRLKALAPPTTPTPPLEPSSTPSVPPIEPTPLTAGGARYF